MGYNPQAHAFLGYSLVLDHFKEVKRVKAFDHNHPEDWTHDPRSGRVLWKEETFYGKGLNCDEDDLGGVKTWEGFQAWVHTPYGERLSEGKLFVGLLHSETYRGDPDMSGSNFDWSQVPTLKAELEQKLRSHKLLNATKSWGGFGLWAALR